MRPQKAVSRKDGLGGILPDQMAKICTHISETEANAAAAERRTIDRFAAALFETRLGETVDGVIVATTSFGAFVRIDDGAADGLLPLHALPDDFYDYDESNNCLEGRHTGWLFATGDELKVKITEVTAISGGILLDWVDGGRIDKKRVTKPDGTAPANIIIRVTQKGGKANDQANQKDANAGLTFCVFYRSFRSRFFSDGRNSGVNVSHGIKEYVSWRSQRPFKLNS